MCTQKIDQKIEELSHSLKGAISDETLCELSALLNYKSVNEQCYELASTGIINALQLNQLKESDRWSEKDQINFYQQLLNQENLNSHKHIFLHTLAQYQSTHQDWAIPTVAKAFEAILRTLYESKKLTKNAILLLMMTREYVAEWITQEEISRLHLEYFYTFNAHDLSLPYSSLFQHSVFHKNINDLKSLIKNKNLSKNLKLYQLVYVNWLFSQTLQYPYNQNALIELIRNKISNANTPERDFELASAKTLLTHHARDFDDSQSSRLKAFINEIDSTGDFHTLFNIVSNNQLQITKSLNNKNTDALINKVQKKTYQGRNSAQNIIAGKTGICLPTRKKLKVAVCISGQLRGYKKAFKSWEKSILVGLDYDVYIHSWKNIGGSGAEPFRKILPFTSNSFKDTYREYCLTLGFESMQQEYPTLFKYLKQSKNTTAEEVKAFYNAKEVVLEDENQPKFDHFSNSDKMHYKVHACHQLVEESGKEYDLIIRIRPDFLISFIAFKWSDIYEICHSQPTIFADTPFGTNYMSCMVGDQLAVGTPETIQSYANTWNIYPQYAENNLLKCGKNFTGHESIAMNCWIHKIKFEKLPVKKGGLIESSAMSNELTNKAISADAKGRNSFWDKKFLDSFK